MAPQFRFQSLLDYRTRLVDDQQLALARATQHLLTCRNEKRLLCLQREEAAKTLQKALSGSLKIAQIDHHHRYLQHLDDLISAGERAIEEAAEQVDQERTALAEALQEKKTLEKLREYDEKALRERIARKEREGLDELNIGRFLRAGGQK